MRDLHLRSTFAASSARRGRVFEMKSWVCATALSAFMCLCGGQPVNAQVGEYELNGVSIKLNGWTVAGTSPDGTIVLFRGPITRSDNGDRRIWERWEYPKDMEDVHPAYRSDIQLVEVRCAQRQMHSLQRITFFGHGVSRPTGWSTADPSDWLYVPPGTMADDLLEIACSANNGVPSGAALIDYAAIHEAAVELHSQLVAGGMIGVTKFSENCFARFRKKPTWSRFDYCVAFDEAASQVDAAVSISLGAPPSNHFIGPSILSRALTNLKLLPPSNSMKELDRLSRMNGQVKLELNAIYR